LHGGPPLGTIPPMNTYELTILLPEGNEKEKTRIMKMIEDFLKKNKGELLKQESWGAKHLAYMIKKMNTADYEHLVISLEPEKQPELDRLLMLDEVILRYLFVRV
jgi:small subunit ribosomal protein S6